MALSYCNNVKSMCYFFHKYIIIYYFINTHLNKDVFREMTNFDKIS